MEIKKLGQFDIAVIGAGHAGCEAALACSRMGKKTVVFSINLEAVANMCGYTHAVFLVKLFRRFTGQSPDEWRRQDRTGTCEG